VGAGRASFTVTSGIRDDVSNSKSPRLLFYTHLQTLSTPRSLVIVSAFVIDFTLTVIMKWEHIIWLATSTAGASPLLQYGQGGTFDYPGLRFGADKKFSITVFSDLHLGERRLTVSNSPTNCTDCLQHHGSALAKAPRLT